MNNTTSPAHAPEAENHLHCPWKGHCPLSGRISHNGDDPMPLQAPVVIDDLRLPGLFPLPCVQKHAPSLIGIPTIDGLEFLKAKEIIRCEGLQRLTKVFTAGGTIISSYNIGEFCKLLGPYGFFSPHKSHLINLQYLRSYQIGGVITLRDGSQAPLARRRREAFLERVLHL